jgi:uncharacterized membrane-anchored protein YjiN (DUF445 family)
VKASSALSPDGLRAGELSRMRIVATGLLVLMAMLFAGATLGQARWPALAYLRAFGEAGLAGACADWFAVTALFRRPLGLPIPHTAIIPRNKARIGLALGGFIADNFLTEAVLQERLRQLELARWGGDWLTAPRNARRLAIRLAGVLPELLTSGPPGALAELSASAAMAAARAAPAAPICAGVLDALWSEGRAQAVAERLIETLGRYVAEHEDDIYQAVVEQSPKWLPRWIDRKIATKVGNGLSKTIQDMADPAHPWREQLRQAVERFAARLRSDPALQAQVEAVKLQLLTDARLGARGSELWTGLEARIGAELGADRRALAGQLQRAMQATGRWLAQDSAAQAELNALGRAVVTYVIAPRRHDIGGFVAQVVAGWDARNVADKLELQVGKDLQYIRINGALVGALVGLAVFTIARLFGLA